MPSVSDIPAVESQITTATRLLSSHWDQTATAAVDAAIEELEAARLDREDGLTAAQKAAIVAAVLLLMRSRFDTPMTDREKARARRMSNDLIVAGVQSGGGFGRLTRSGRAISTLSRRGGAELEALGRWRARGEAFERRIAASVEDFVERQEARRKPHERKADEKKLRRLLMELREEENARRVAEGKRPLTSDVKLLPPPEKSDGRVSAEDRKEWLADMRATMDLASHSSGPIADAWAYRQYNIGRYISMRAAGIRTFEVFNNPPSGPDDRTTRFCRWAHRKVIKVERVERQLSEMARAVREDDRAIIEQAWPMLRLRKGDTAAGFRQMFIGTGLPPYHWRCRSVVQEGGA